MRRMRPLFVVAVLGTGCAADVGPRVINDPDSAALFDRPWPSDERRRDDGTPDMSGWPNPNGLGLLDDYLALAETIPGFGTNAPIYLRFDRPIDTGRLPTPSGSLSPDSPLWLIDVDPASPRFGERFPVQWEFQESATTYEPDNQLAVAPVYGFPLRPDTTYALVVTTALAAPDPEFATRWDEDHPHHDLYAGLADALVFHGLGPRDVAVATVFTTGDPTDELARVARFLREDVEVPDLDQEITPLYDYRHFRVYEGRYASPVFTRGARPYTTEGGGFVFADDGDPIVQGWDAMRLSICTPRNLDKMPAGGWPVVIQQHGTGGDYLSHCSDNSEMEVAAQLADVGFISVGIDQPLHGTRVGDGEAGELEHFNFLNPESGRSNFRQGAIDAIFLAHALASRSFAWETDTGDVVRTDPGQIYFLGHSQGGITGAIAAPFFGDDVKAAVISGAGGVLAITVVQRKDPTDIAAALATVAGFADDEEVTPLHPVVGLVQQMVEVTDPINYAPFWYAEDGGFYAQAPTDVLMFSGLLDVQTPHETAEALAAAARMPQVSPAANAPDAFALRDLSPVELPLTAAVPAWDGTEVTAAIAQFADRDHFVIWTDPVAAAMYRDFLATAAAGEATVDR